MGPVLLRLFCNLGCVRGVGLLLLLSLALDPATFSMFFGSC